LLASVKRGRGCVVFFSPPTVGATQNWSLKSSVCVHARAQLPRRRGHAAGVQGFAGTVSTTSSTAKCMW